MVDFEYLPRGLNAMARAHQVSTMSGHLGAAVVTGYFLAEQYPDLDERVCQGIEGELNRIIAGESVFSPRKNASLSSPEMFVPFAKEAPRENLIDGIADALSKNIGQARESGHNVIFASIAIRALKGHPEFATPSVIEGIRKLIAGFNNASPGSGYYGKEKGRINGNQVELPDDAAFPPYTSLETMADLVVDELIQHAEQRRDGFGGLWHLINHAAALVELSRQGYTDLAIKGLAAHYQHFRLFRTVPNVADELGAETPTEFDPRTPEFWDSEKIRRDRAHLTHRIKTLYGFDTLVELVDDAPERESANAKLRYLM